MNISLKIHSVTLLFFILSLHYSCDLTEQREEKLYNDRLCIYEFELATNDYKLIKTFDYGSGGPYLSYYHNDNNKIIFGQYDKIYIINTDDNKEDVIMLDSLFLSDSFISLSPSENKIAFTAFRIPISSDAGNGLFLLDINKREIEVLKSITSKEVRDWYHLPQYSNKGNLIVYKHHNNASDGSTGIDLPKHLSQIFVIDLSTKIEKQVYSSKAAGGVEYALFDNTDSNLILIENNNKLLKINLSDESVDTLDNKHYFDYYTTIDDYPRYLISNSKIYYTCHPENILYENYQIFEYDMNSKLSGYLIDGEMPLSVNKQNGDILIRSCYNYSEAKSDIYVVSNTGAIIKTLQNGVRGIFSPNGDKVLLLIKEKANY